MKKAGSFVFIFVVILFLLLIGCGRSQTPSSMTPPNTLPTQTDVMKIMTKSSELPGLSYDFRISTKDMSSLTGTSWLQGRKARTEFVLQGEKIITLYDGEIAYQCLPAANIAVRFTAKDLLGRYIQSIDSPLTLVERLKTRTLTVESIVILEEKKCILASYTENGIKHKLWIDEAHGIPLRIEMSGLNMDLLSIEYTNIKTSPLADDTFMLPKGMHIQELSEVMKGLSPIAKWTP